jgi:precorrin-8X/cobalt-precorrin-8 methylmutase
MQTKKGQSIEDASMQMIEDEIGSHDFSEKEWPIVRRIIHSTADFDFADKNRLIFHKDAIQSGMNALKNGCSIVVDVNGVIGGMNKQNPKDYGNNIVCNISKPEIMELAKKEGKTRSQVSMRVAASDIDGGVVAIGNAPTALQEVIQMVKEGISKPALSKPALIIGIPVGFICAAESKEELSKLEEAPFITNIGRKGGSSSVSATINALFKLIRAESSF